MIELRSEAGVFFFNDTATTKIYTLSLHDALPISSAGGAGPARWPGDAGVARHARGVGNAGVLVGGERALCARSEEHKSELQSRQYLVCRLLLEKKIPKVSTSLNSPRFPSSSQIAH